MTNPDTPFYRPQPPVLNISDPQIREAYEIALDNLNLTNTVPCPPQKYNQTGLLDTDLGLMIRAGGNYASPWTRDASINAWNCASFLTPRVAENTLWAVCQRDRDGKLILQMDDQCWDKIIWATAAWNHYLLCGDETFLARAYETVRNTLAALEKTAFNAQYGLFTGGSFFNDGISGYPADLHEPGNPSSFVGDHPAVREIMTLSTNCIYRNAYAVAGKMAGLCHEDGDVYARKGNALAKAINTYLWNEERGSYDYFLYPDGRTCQAQEACGICFAILFRVYPPERAGALLDALERGPWGLPSILPPFPGLFSREQPGRHNNLIWPFINGFFLTALSRLGRSEMLGEELTLMARLAVGSDHAFYEIYNPYTGQPDGGWQIGRHWGSCHHQTWSATGFLRGVFHGLFGMQAEREGMAFRPCLPRSLSGCTLEGLPLGFGRASVCLKGSGSRIVSVTVDGEPVEDAFLPYAEGGSHRMEITLSEDTL